jgi:hypothetical protein
MNELIVKVLHQEPTTNQPTNQLTDQPTNQPALHFHIAC